MAGTHPNDMSPYLVSLGDTPPVPVDPAGLEDDSCRLIHVRDNRYVLHRGHRTVALIIDVKDRHNIVLTHGAQSVTARVQDHRDQLLAALSDSDGNAGRETRIESPMPGLVLKVLVEVGQHIQRGDSLLVLEAMKMENEIKAHFDGEIAAIKVAKGDAVGKGHVLVEFS